MIKLEHTLNLRERFQNAAQEHVRESLRLCRAGILKAHFKKTRGTDTVHATLTGASTFALIIEAMKDGVSGRRLETMGVSFAKKVLIARTFQPTEVLEDPNKAYQDFKENQGTVRSGNSAVSAAPGRPSGLY